MLVVVFGLPGSGKSYFAERLARRMKAEYLSSDRLRMEMPARRSYSDREKEQVYHKMLETMRDCAQEGLDVVLDATFYRSALREEVTRKSNEPVVFIEVRAEEATIRRRLQNRRKYSEADFEVYTKVKSRFEPMTADHLVLNSTDGHIQDMLHAALEYLFNAGWGGRWAAIADSMDDSRVRVEQLAREGRYNGRPINGELIETHISWVVLGEVHAFKLKKPIQYSFLDFTTPARRRYYCWREVFLNRRLSDIYLDVLEVRKSDEGLSLGGETGQVVDYAVRMLRMDESLKMDVMLRHDAVTSEHMKRLAAQVARFHLDAEVVHDRPNMALMKEDFNDILRSTDWISEHLGEKSARAVHRMVTASDAFLNSRSALMEQRVRDGFQRDVHGDLHAKNIFLYEDPVVFDCIEFNDHLRRIDLLNEIAFFCMDLEAFGHDELAEQFLKTYLEYFPETLSGKAEQVLLTYYKFYRANVRAKVNALRGMQAKPEELPALVESVRRYIALMETYGRALVGE